jgi:hypothetical protein
MRRLLPRLEADDLGQHEGDHEQVDDKPADE